MKFTNFLLKMNEFLLAASGCITLGILTTMHPCPLTANIAAITFLSSSSQTGSEQIRRFALFGMGYLLALTGIAISINFGLVSIPRLSVYLQSILSAFLGPMLIIVGMVISGIINLNNFYKSILPQNFYGSDKPSFYVFLMGGLLAMSFCPATAFIYFGILIPFSIDLNQLILFPVLFALGALIPIVAISTLVNRGLVTRLNREWFKKINLIAGGLLIITGIYISLNQLYF